jgi:hypothetical protein
MEGDVPACPARDRLFERDRLVGRVEAQRTNRLDARHPVGVGSTGPRHVSKCEAAMHSPRTAILAILVALILSAPAVLAETSPPVRSNTAGPISVELAKKCRALALKAHPKPAGAGPYKQAQREYYEDCIAKGGNVPD